jgi:hypothetical protein
MKHLAIYLCLLLAVTGVARSAPPPRNLGQGLLYYRLHQLPADLPTDESERRQPCILDLRYVDGHDAEATALAAWLKFHATPRAPVLILANAETSRGLIAAIEPRGAGAAVVVLGNTQSPFTPDIPVKISAEAERRAYDALDHGTPAESLITENPDKPRNDEAKLAKERQSDPSPGTESSPAAATATSTDESPKEKSTPPVIDAVLQRAVHLHRTLVALRKL